MVFSLKSFILFIHTIAKLFFFCFVANCSDKCFSFKTGTFGYSAIRCSYSNGRKPDSAGDGVKSVEKLLVEKQRAELSARIASGEFTVEKSGYEYKLYYFLNENPLLPFQLKYQSSISILN